MEPGGASGAGDGVEVVRRQHEVEGELQADADDEEGEEDAQLLGAKPSGEPDTELRADHSADEQDDGEEHVDGAALHRVQDRGEGGDEEELEEALDGGVVFDVGELLELGVAEGLLLK